MKRFLAHFLAILALVALLLWLCDLVYTTIYQEAAPRSKFRYVMHLNKQSFDVVFLGSSRVENQIDTRLFNELSHSKTYNLGTSGSALTDNLLELKLFLRKATVKCVLLQLDFNLEQTQSTQIFMADAMPFIDDPLVKAYVQENHPDFKALNYVPFYRYAMYEPKIGFRELFFSLLNKKTKYDLSSGYAPKSGHHFKPMRDSIMGESIVLKPNRAYNQIKELCRQKNMQLMVFISPFCSKINAESYIEKMKKMAPDLIDLSRNYPDSVFYDCEHLNEQGSKILTTRLYEATQGLFRSK